MNILRASITVQVTNVTLIYGNSEAPPTVQVARNTSIPFSCTTSVSRPTATIVWYIGTEEKQRSSSSSIFIFTPQNSDHDKQIFCKAFNIQQENKAVSSNKAKLYVQGKYLIKKGTVYASTLTDIQIKQCKGYTSIVWFADM